MKRILVRADDLGYSRAVNYGIYDAIHSGIINNVGVMISMPFAKHGLDLLKDENIDFGIHTNISNGKPVLPADKVSSLVDEHGNFKKSKVYRSNFSEVKPDFVNLDEAILEIDAQYHKFLELTGKKPDYMDSHAVLSKNFITALKTVANKYQVPCLDIEFGNEPVSFKEQTTFNVFMESMNKDYDPKEMIKKMINHAEDRDIPMMIGHPGYLDQYILNTSSLTIPRTQEVEMAMDPKIAKLIKDNDIHLLRYSECK